MPRIASIAFTPNNIERKPADRFARVASEQVNLITGFGVEGDVKGGVEGRHLNIMLANDVADLTSDRYHTGPGQLGEQIVIDGFVKLPVGAQLRLGNSAIIAVEEVREPCGRFESIQGHPKDEAIGRIGYMASVVAGGPIAVGDDVQLI